MLLKLRRRLHDLDGTLVLAATSKAVQQTLATLGLEEQFIRAGLDVHFEVVTEADKIVSAFLTRLEKQKAKKPTRPLRRTV